MSGASGVIVTFSTTSFHGHRYSLSMAWIAMLMWSSMIGSVKKSSEGGTPSWLRVNRRRVMRVATAMSQLLVHRVAQAGGDLLADPVVALGGALVVDAGVVAGDLVG